MTPFERELCATMPALYRYARKLDRNGADDLVQETVMRALTRPHQFQDGTSMRKWLMSIMYTRFVNETRTSASKRARPGGANHVHLDDMTIGLPASQEDTIFLKEVLKEVGKLAIHYRQTMLMNLEGMTGEEIAATLNISLPTVRSRTNRAREILRATQ